ncbi:MAG: SEL1-like repeat protein [Magnetococcales bacterium]|nr:SEL1-like repeat protein [Magnetococcales bacterium]
MTLWSDFLNNNKRAINKSMHYFPVYERHFASFINQSVTFIEIGCGSGGSLQMWKRYFGPYATIIGIDINPMCKYFEEDQIFVRIGPQQDGLFLQSVLDEFGTPDIVLDDGSHIQSHVVASFNYLYHKISKNGVYVVEDLHTAYWSEYEGGLRRDGSFIESCKNMVDSLNANHDRTNRTVSDFTKDTVSMHFYDSMVAFERGRHKFQQATVPSPEHDTEIVHWYRWGVDRGDAWAQRSLAYLYVTGAGGVQQDYAEAVRLFRMAAEQGEVTAQANLGTMMANGQGTPRDHVTALMWFEIAASSGNQHAVSLYKTLSGGMTRSQIEQAREMARGWRLRSS